MSKQVFNLEFYGKTLTVEAGELAKQANGSVDVYKRQLLYSSVI